MSTVVSLNEIEEIIPALGFIPLKADRKRNIIGCTMMPSARLIQEIYQKKAKQRQRLSSSVHVTCEM